MPRLGVGALLLLAAMATGAAAEDPKEPAIASALLRTLEKRGFAVDGDSSVGLFSTYRHPGDDPVYVSADAGIALYLLLLHQAVDEECYAGDAELRRDAAAWAMAVRTRCPGEGGRSARFIAEVFAVLAGGDEKATSADLREAVAAQVARILGRSPPGKSAELLATELDEASLVALGRTTLSPENARHDRAIGWITRVRLPSSPAGDTSRLALVETIPPTLLDRVVRPFGRAGIDRIVFPGRTGIFDVEIRGDHRFPPGTLPTHAGLVGLDRGRSLGSAFASAILAEDPFAKGIRPDEEATRPGRPGLGFDALLARLARPMDAGVPALFQSEEWEALSLQSTLAADALYRRAMGPAAQPPRVFGAKGIAGFVHPDAGFWQSLAAMASGLDSRLGPVAREVGYPPRDRILEALDRLTKCFADWKPLPEEDLWVLRRCRPDGYWMANVEHVGSSEVPEEKRPDYDDLVLHRAAACVGDALNRTPPGEPAGEVHPSIARRRPSGMLRRLAEISTAFAAIAESQVKGVEAKGLQEALYEFGFLCEDAEGFPSMANPHSGCVVVLDDGPRRLTHGSAGLHDLWLLYPWKGAKVRARGVVLGYREWVGDEWPDDARWKGIVRTTPPPSWATGALLPVPAESK